jgi:exopolysaccharide production protein ExoZ
LYRHLAYHFFLVPIRQPQFIIPQAWTLSYELMFYFAFCAFFLVPRRVMPWLLSAWFVAGAINFTGALQPNPRPSVWPLSPLVMEFLLGCYAAIAIRKFGAKHGTPVLMAGLVLGAVAIALNVTKTVHSGPHEWLRLLCFGVPSALIIYGLTARETTGRTTLPRRLQPLGDASYSIYLAHYLGIWPFYFAGAFAVECGWPVQAMLMVVMAVLGTTAGWLVHIWVERPLMNWRKKSYPMPKPPGLQALFDPATLRR